MKRLIISLFFLFGVYAVCHSQNFVSCMILDKTGSMVGIGDGHGENIWPDVQKYCCEMVDNLTAPAELVIYTFDAKCSSPKCFKIDDNDDKSVAKEYIRGIVADGKSTAIYKALDTALDYLKSNYSNSNQLIYLITDGRDNASSIPFKQALGKFSADKGEYDHLYYIDLRGTINDEDKKAIEEESSASIHKGTEKTAAMKTIFKVVNYTLGVSQYAEQRFEASSLGESEKGYFKFNATVGDVNDINVDISPSKNLSVSELEEIEKGKYAIRFRLDFLGNAPQECEIPVILQGINDAGHAITFEPSAFVIRVSKKHNPIVIAPGGGWK